MANTKTEICNLALNRIGESLIRSVDDDSKNAARCKLVFDHVYEQVLRNHNWKCATYRKTLNLLSTDPAFGYDYQYQLPTDPKCIKPLFLTDNNYDFVIEEDQLLTDMDEAQLVYIGKSDNYSKLDPLFIKVLYLSIAVELSYCMTENNTILNGLMGQLNAAWEDARFTDASEGRANIYDYDTWVQAGLTSGNITTDETNIK